MKPLPTDFYDSAIAEDYLQRVSNDSSIDFASLLPPSDDDQYALALETLVKADIRRRWDGMSDVDTADLQEATIGMPPPLESYLERFPLLADQDAVLRLAEWEFVARRDAGNRPVIAEYTRRFPEIEDLPQHLRPYEVVETETPTDRVDRLVGTSIGPYDIESKIGEGGFGDVYLAQQTQPVKRKVALKVLKRGMDSTEVVSRFQAEQQALALMDHVNIAQVLDAGITDSGVSYFVMTYVDGIPITEYCDFKGLSVEQRIGIFQDVCGAIQHAHQKGVIHRDIKPSNILVSEENGEPIAKVIDFGIAKAVGNSITGDSIATQYGQIIGTPQYMSPEQASFNPNDVDTRSDVYSLGVVLYELLTGSPPFRQEDLQAKAIDEVLRTIREVDPAKPSSRISTVSGQDKPILKSHSVANLKSLLRSELDWIVMRSLEKDRERRYESPSAFADDLCRYSRNEPVMAGPPSAMYRIRKFVSRYSRAIAVAVAFFCLLVGSAIASTLLAMWAMDSERIATENLQKAERLTKQSQYQTASLSLREAERSMASQRIPDGLMWYVHAMETAPADADEIHRVAHQNLAQWMPMVDAPQQSKELDYVFSGSLVMDIPAERVGNYVLGRFARLDETASMEKLADDIVFNDVATEYCFYHEHDLSAVAPAIAPPGRYLDHWVDLKRQRLITAHLTDVKTVPVDAAEARAALLKEMKAREGQAQRDKVYLRNRKSEPGEIVVQQWSIETGKELTDPIRIAGGYAREGLRSFRKNGVRISLDKDVLLNVNHTNESAQVWSLSTCNRIGDPLKCLDADLRFDGGKIATCDATGSVRLFSVSDTEVHLDDEFEVEGEVLGVAFANQGFAATNDLIAIDASRQLHLWSESTGHSTGELPVSEQDPVIGFTTFGNSVLIAMQKSGVFIWDLAVDKPFTQIVDTHSFSTSVAVFNRGRYFAACGPRELKIWDARESVITPVTVAREQRESQFPGNGNLVIHGGPMSQLISAEFESGTTRYWRIADDEYGSHPEEIVLDSGEIEQAAFANVNPDHTIIHRMTLTGETATFDALTGQLNSYVHARAPGTISLPIDFSSDSATLLALSMPKFELAKMQLQRIPIAPHRTAISQVKSNDANVAMHPTQRIAILSDKDSPAWFAENGNSIVAIGVAPKRVVIRDAKDGAVRHETTFDDEITFNGFHRPSSGSTFLLQGLKFGDHVFQLWDAASGVAIGPTITLQSEFAVSPDAKHIFSVPDRRIFNTRSGDARLIEHDTSTDALAAAFSQDSNRVAIALPKGELVVCDVDALDVLSSTQVGEEVEQLHFVADDQLLIFTANKRWLKFSGSKLTDGGVFVSPLADVRLAPDRNSFAALSEDGRLQMFDIETGRKIGPAARFPGAYETMEFASDGSSLSVLTDSSLSVLPFYDLGDRSDGQLIADVQTLTGLHFVDQQMIQASIPTAVAINAAPELPTFWTMPRTMTDNHWPTMFTPIENQPRLKPPEPVDVAPVDLAAPQPPSA